MERARESKFGISMRDAVVTLPKRTACSVELNAVQRYRPNPPAIDLTGTVFKNLSPESEGGDDVFDAAGKTSP